MDSLAGQNQLTRKGSVLLLERLAPPLRLRLLASGWPLGPRSGESFACFFDGTKVGLSNIPTVVNELLKAFTHPFALSSGELLNRISAGQPIETLKVVFPTPLAQVEPVP